MTVHIHNTTIPRPTLGQPAPPLRFIDSSGAEWSLDDHLGRVVVLVFHRHIH